MTVPLLLNFISLHCPHPIKFLQIVKDRSRRLTKLFESFTPYLDLVGTTVPVWFDLEVSVSSDGKQEQSVGKFLDCYIDEDKNIHSLT